jgi:hypothetical protein
MTPEKAVQLLLLESEWAEKTGLSDKQSPYCFNHYRAIAKVLADLIKRIERLEDNTLDNKQQTDV